MTEYELLRIISFLGRMRAPYDEILHSADPDPSWNIALHLMKSHLRGENVTMSSLASSAGVPFASAMRRLHRLIDDGDIVLRPRTKAGKSHFLDPSTKMRDDFTRYAKRVKSLLAETFGLVTPADDDEDYYFGGSYFARQIIPPLDLIAGNTNAGSDLKFLLHDDNYFSAMRDMWADIRSKLSSRKNFKLLGLPELHSEAFENGTRAKSRYDVMALNMPWLGEAVSRNLIQPLTGFLEQHSINPLDFHPNIWATGTWNRVQYGIPIYCTIETLAARKDLFQLHDISMPTSFDRVIEAAKALRDPKRGIHGIVWNAARGMPISHSFMFFMGCCGSPILNFSTSRLSLDYSRINGDQLRPKVLSEEGFRTLDYMRRLIAVSPPDVLTTDWNKSLDVFMTGHAAMSYCWTMRAARFEYDIHSAVKGKVEYLPQPHGPGGVSISPIGGFLLTIPRGLPPSRARLAFDAVAWMASPAAMKEHVKNGFPVAPRFSVSADPEAAASTPIVRFVDRLAKRNKLQTWQRPPIPEYRLIEEILGEEIFKAVSGESSDRAALENSQQKIDQVMRKAGYY